MAKLKTNLHQFIWHLNDPKRAALCIPFGVGMFLLGWHWGWGWQVSFLAGWIMALGLYLVLLGMSFLRPMPSKPGSASPSGPDQVVPADCAVLVALLGNMSVAVILTAVGQRPAAHARLFLSLSVIAVILSWLLLHTAFGQHYARLYYEDRDRHGNPFPAGFRQGFQFPGTPDPTYGDFLYVSFAVGLTYAMSDVDVTNEVQRRTVLSTASFPFSFIPPSWEWLNAIVTS